MEKVSVLPQSDHSVGTSLMKECEFLLHLKGWEERCVRHSQRVENKISKVLIQREPRDTFNQSTNPVHIYTVLPLFSGLVDERMSKYILLNARVFHNPDRVKPFLEFGVGEAVSETSCEAALV